MGRDNVLLIWAPPGLNTVLICKKQPWRRNTNVKGMFLAFKKFTVE